MADIFDGVKMSGNGWAESDGEVNTNTSEPAGDGIDLPPIPDNAEEYSAGGTPENSLEQIAAEEAEGIPQLIQVSDVDDPTNTGDAAQNALSDIAEEAAHSLDMIVDTLAIVTDPMPTATSDEGFKPDVQNAIYDSEKEGGAAKVVARGGIIESVKVIDIKQVDPSRVFDTLGKQDGNFNPGTVQNALDDSSVEGGIVSSKTTGTNPGNPDRAKEGFQIKEGAKTDTTGQYRLYGFTVQYLVSDATATRNVSDMFDDLETACVSVNGTKYLMPTPDGAFKVVNIVSGIPEIAYQDQRIYRYSENEWVRS